MYCLTNFRVGHPFLNMVCKLPFLSVTILGPSFSVTTLMSMLFLISVIRRFSLAKMRRRHVKLCIMRLLQKKSGFVMYLINAVHA